MLPAGLLPAPEPNGAGHIDFGEEGRRDDRRRLLLEDHGRPVEPGAGTQARPVIGRHVHHAARSLIERGTHRVGLGLVRRGRLACGAKARDAGDGLSTQGDIDDLKVLLRDFATEQLNVARDERLPQRGPRRLGEGGAAATAPRIHAPGRHSAC